jgi:hypothetical protein
MKLIKLSELDGRSVYFGDGGLIIETPAEGDTTLRGKTKITWNGASRFVLESIDKVVLEFEKL